jgi:hypothetical protein
LAQNDHGCGCRTSGRATLASHLAARGSKSFLRAVVYAAAAEKSERVTWFEIREV